MPPEETVMMRDGALARSTGSSRVVSTYGPMTWPAMVSSTPPAVVW
jgi:hypothetical protein